MGDITTPALVSLVRARASGGRVELAWYAPARDIASATVERRALHGGWVRRGEVWSDNGWLLFEDAQVTPGARYGYRLAVTEAGEEAHVGETWVDVPAAAPLALAIRANPTTRGIEATFSLPDASPARLELFDVGGRRVAAREVGGLGAGSHVVTIGDGLRLAPGTYLLRLSRGMDSVTTRAVLLQ
jgi:hypothetical protein